MISIFSCMWGSSWLWDWQSLVMTWGTVARRTWPSGNLPGRQHSFLFCIRFSQPCSSSTPPTTTEEASLTRNWKQLSAWLRIQRGPSRTSQQCRKFKKRRSQPWIGLGFKLCFHSFSVWAGFTFSLPSRTGIPQSPGCSETRGTVWNRT